MRKSLSLFFVRIHEARTDLAMLFLLVAILIDCGFSMGRSVPRPGRSADR
jgi:hypothetical protein